MFVVSDSSLLLLLERRISNYGLKRYEIQCIQVKERLCYARERIQQPTKQERDERDEKKENAMVDDDRGTGQRDGRVSESSLAEASIRERI